MRLTKYRLGDLVELSTENNGELKYGLKDVKGLSIQKKFIETKANMKGVSLKPYLLVKENDFVYVSVTSRNGEKITLAYNQDNKEYIVSSSYIVFRLKDENILLSKFLFMYFNRSEFDRFSRFNSWGSARETFSWEDMCDIELDLPWIDIQKKYVYIYNAMIENQKSYEKGLEDLKLVCDVYIEDLRRKMKVEEIGGYIEIVREKNIDNKYENVKGIESSGSFIDTRANMVGVNTKNYIVVSKNNIAYNPSRINLGSIALYSENDPCIVSPMYCVFKVNENVILPEYLMMWLSRKEFNRYTLYHAMGSVRDTFDFNLMTQVKIPIPKISIQQSIVNIYKVYQERKEINEKLKQQIKDICPILIKGSIEEARK